MKKTLILIVLILSSCKINDVVQHHGVNFLHKKQEKLIINTSNINDIREILGPPSVESVFDNNLLIYMERKTKISSFKSFGSKEILVNDILLLETDDRGLLIKKDYFNKEQMNKLKISKKKY